MRKDLLEKLARQQGLKLAFISVQGWLLYYVKTMQGTLLNDGYSMDGRETADFLQNYLPPWMEKAKAQTAGTVEPSKVKPY